METDDSTLPQEPPSVTTTTPPSTASITTKPAKPPGTTEKRNKSTHACDYCKKKKVKCNGEQPCARCQKLSIECSYVRHLFKRDAPNNKMMVSSREVRLRALEKALDALQVDSPPSDVDNCQQLLNVYPTIKVPLDKFNVSSIGQPYYGKDWETRLDRIPPMFDRLTLIDNEPRKPDAIALPETSINMDLLTAYFAHVHPYFPMLHRASFFLHLQDTSPLLLNAIYAIADQWVHIDAKAAPSNTTTTKPATAASSSSSSSSSSSTLAPGFKYYQNAIALVELYTDAPRLSTIQALLLIIKYHELSQRPGFFCRTRFYFNIVVRMCRDLGLSRELPLTCQVYPLVAEQRRRTFWAAYIYDLLMSTELGTPVHFSMGESTVALPNLLDDEKDTKDQHDTVLYFHWMTMVMKAQGAVLQFLRRKYAAVTRQQDDLEQHKQSLHQHMLALGKELQLWKEPARGRVNFLFLAYHFTNILMYRPVALDLIRSNRQEDLTLTMRQDQLEKFLLKESAAITNIVDLLLREHTVDCLHYSFRGLQQTIHYLTASWTVQLMYQHTDNDRSKILIQQLTPFTPALELRSLAYDRSVVAVSPSKVQPKDEGKIKDKDTQSLSNQMVSAASDPVPTATTTTPKISATTVASAPAATATTAATTTTRSSSNVATPTDLPYESDNYNIPQTLGYPPYIQKQSIPFRSHSSIMANQQQQHHLYYSPPPPNLQQQQQQSSMMTYGSTRPHLILDTSTLSMMQLPSAATSSSSNWSTDSSPMIPTPPFGSSSSSSSSSTSLTPISATGDSRRSLRLRRSHQQLRNPSHRLSSSSTSSTSSSSNNDPRTGTPIHHHPYMPPAPAPLQPTHRRHTVSSGQSSPSSLPSSPLHRMTLSDDPWIQAPPVILPSQPISNEQPLYNMTSLEDPMLSASQSQPPGTMMELLTSQTYTPTSFAWDQQAAAAATTTTTTTTTMHMVSSNASSPSSLASSTMYSSPLYHDH